MGLSRKSAYPLATNFIFASNHCTASSVYYLARKGKIVGIVVIITNRAHFMVSIDSGGRYR